MTKEEITARIEAIESKIERANALIEKNEKKAGELKQQAADMGIVFPENQKGEIWFSISGEVERLFANQEDKINDFYWNVIVKYEHLTDQAVSNRKKVEEMTARIANLRAKLGGRANDEIEFDALPQIIKDFLANWQRQAIEYYIHHHDNSKQDMFRHRSVEYIEKAIQREAQDKGLEISRRVAAKCGKIIDAAGISIGQNGTINGQIIGDKGSATVETIYAGGYNIQCLHFRVLVK